MGKNIIKRNAAAKAVADARAIQEKADAENRAITVDEDKAIQALLDQSTASLRSAELEEEMAVREAKLAEPLPIRPCAPPATSSTSEFLIPAEAHDPAEKKRHGFRDLGQFALAVAAASTPGSTLGDADRNRLFIGAAQGLRQGLGSEGGYAVPPAFSTQIWDGLNTGTQNLLAMTDSYTVDGESLTFPANAETSRVAGSRYGGVRGYWISEAAQITKSTPTFRQVKIEPQQLAVLVYATEKLLRNSPVALNQYVTRAATDEINFMVADAIINGTGSGQPQGITNSGAIVTVSKEGSQTADTVIEANITKMWARLHVNSRANAVWLANQDVEPQLDILSTTLKNVAGSENVGGSISPLYDRAKRELKGRPVIFCEQMATIGDLNDLVLADLKGYVTGVRGGIETQMSMHLRFDYAETAFRFIFEVDGKSWLAAPLTPFKGSNTLSTFVNLQAR